MGRASLLLGCALGVGAAGLPAAAPAAVLELEVSAGLVSLRASGVPLGEVLQALGEAGGFTLVLRGDLAMPVWDEFAGRPLERAAREPQWRIARAARQAQNAWPAAKEL